ncbi:MAG: CsgG/HfaB family protein [Thermodesulfobacteriota bacterium]
MKSKIISLAGLSFFVLALVGCAIGPTAKVTATGGPTIAEAQLEPYSGPKARIAVARFVDKSGKGMVTGEIGQGMADMLATALFNTNRFIVLEREILQDILAEQDLATTGRVRKETAAPTGLIEGAELLVTGAVTEFEPGAAAAGAGGGMGAYILGAIKASHIAIDIRIIDTKTSRIVAATSVEGKAKDFTLGGLLLSGVSVGGVALGGYSKTPVEKAIRIALGEAVRFIVSQTPAQYFHYTEETLLPAKEKPTPTVAPTISELPSQITVIVAANIRSGPGTSYGIVGSVKKGEILSVLGEEGDWYNVELPDGKTGWIHKKLTSR